MKRILIVCAALLLGGMAAGVPVDEAFVAACMDKRRRMRRAETAGLCVNMFASG